MTVGQNIKNYRIEKGLTQKRLAELTGLATGTIQQYELEKRQPRLEQLQKIADILEINIETLLGNQTIVNLKNDDFQDEDIIRIQRARKNMPDKEKEKMMNILKASFDEYFSDDYINEDTDE